MEIVEFNNGKFALRRRIFFTWYYFDFTVEYNDMWWDKDDLIPRNFYNWCSCDSEEDLIANYKRIISNKREREKSKDNNKIKIVNRKKVTKEELLNS